MTFVADSMTLVLGVTGTLEVSLGVEVDELEVVVSVFDVDEDEEEEEDGMHAKSNISGARLLIL